MRPTGLLYVLLPSWILNEVMRWFSQLIGCCLQQRQRQQQQVLPLLPPNTHTRCPGRSLSLADHRCVSPGSKGAAAGRNQRRTAVFSRLVWGRVDEFPVGRARCWAPLRWRDTNIRTGAAAATTERPRWVHSERDSLSRWFGGSEGSENTTPHILKHLLNFFTAIHNLNLHFPVRKKASGIWTHILISTGNCTFIWSKICSLITLEIKSCFLNFN